MAVAFVQTIDNDRGCVLYARGKLSERVDDERTHLDHHGFRVESGICQDGIIDRCSQIRKVQCKLVGNCRK